MTKSKRVVWRDEAEASMGLADLRMFQRSSSASSVPSGPPASPPGLRMLLEHGVQQAREYAAILVDTKALSSTAAAKTRYHMIMGSIAIDTFRFLRKNLPQLQGILGLAPSRLDEHDLKRIERITVLQVMDRTTHDNTLDSTSEHVTPRHRSSQIARLLKTYTSLLVDCLEEALMGLLPKAKK